VRRPTAPVVAFEHVVCIPAMRRRYRQSKIMNKIVKKYYPIERLPADLRSGLQEHGWVRIEIEPETAPPSERAWLGWSPPGKRCTAMRRR
jgi:hypothetical protein